MSTSPSDTVLLLACRNGDATAWETLVNRYQRLVYTVPRRAGLGEDLAADVFQKVFLKLFEQLGKIERPERLSAWLVTTARRETWAMIRREQPAGKLTQLDDQAEMEELVEPSVLPDEQLEQLEEQHMVRLALGDLDDRCRRLLTMLFYSLESPSYALVAAELGVPEGSIGPTRARCLQRLRKALETAGF